MRGEKQIRAAMPSMTVRELWLVACDVRRAADAAAIGGASSCEWMGYVNLESDAMWMINQREPFSPCPFPHVCTDGWTPEEKKELEALYRRIMKGGKHGK